MKTLWNIVEANNISSLAVSGLAKNVGKTVTLNYLLAHAAGENLQVGLTSIGRDGELWDVLNHRRKPLISPAPGTLIATSEKSLAAATARLSILMETDFRTPLGNIVIARTDTAGRVELAGPSTLKQLQVVLDILRNAGAATILVDGALDRLSFASPAVTDACILATGAILGNTPEEAVEMTRERVQQFMTPQAGNDFFKHYHKDSVTILADNLIVKQSTAKMLSRGRNFWQQWDKISAIIFGGALTQVILEGIATSGVNLKNLKLIVRDATYLFADLSLLQQFTKAGVEILTINKLKLLAVTINPTSPEGQNWDPKKFYQIMAEAVPEIPVFDLVAGLRPE